MSTATALRVHSSIFTVEHIDKTDLEGWADTAAKLLDVGGAEIERLQARDGANVETIKHLASLLAARS